jgi:hypothetical protein
MRWVPCAGRQNCGAKRVGGKGYRQKLTGVGHSIAVAIVLSAGTSGCRTDQIVTPRAQVQRELPQRMNNAHLIHWDALSDDSLWVYISASRGQADVGLRSPGKRGMDRGRVLLGAAERAAVLQSLEGQQGVQVLRADTLLPIAKVLLSDKRALRALRESPVVEYVEPAAFVDPHSRRTLGWASIDWGCSVGPYAGPLVNTYVWPGDVLPWNYRVMNIDSAWINSTGRGVTIGIVDTGVDENVGELNWYFDDFMSAGRTFTKMATKPAYNASNAWHDNCGHGTRMASVIGAPRNGYGIVGVAWGANLHAVRVDDDVILTEVEATRLGIRDAASRARIVAMAFGTYAYYSSIAQEISYWYYNSDRLLLAAAGTTSCLDPFHYVTFPGTLETVTTVTGFQYGGGLACNVSRGWQVDFAAYTNQPAQGLVGMGTILSGIEGSSGATAVIAGMAALYLALHPSASRWQLLTALTYAASPTGFRSPLWGFGAPDGLCLVGEMCTAWIEGPNLIQESGTYTWTIRQAASPGPFNYRWSSGETTQTITRDVTVYPGMLEYAFQLNMSITDNRNGRTRSDNKTVIVRYPYSCPTCY